MQREAADSPTPWHHDWGNIVLAGLFAYVVVYVLWLTFEWGSERTFTIVRELAYPPVMLAGVVLAWRIARVGGVDRRIRRAWTVIGSAFLIWFSADLIWAYYHITGAPTPSPSPFDPAYLLSSLVLAAGVLMFPAAGSLTRQDRTRFWIDCGIIITGLSALTAYVIIGPGYLRASPGVLEASILLGYPISHMLVLVALFSIMVRRPGAGSVGVLMLLGAGLFLYAGSDFWWTYLEVRDIYAPGALTYGVWMIAQALLVASPQRHFDVINRNLPSSEPGQFAHRVRVVVPYLAAGIGLVIVAATALPEIMDRFGLIIVFLGALVTLIVARQIVTLRENDSLRVEQAMRQSEERFRALVEYSSDIVTVLDRDLRCRFQSPSTWEVLNRKPGEFLGTFLDDWIEDADRNQAQTAFGRIISGESSREKFEWRMNGGNGAMVYLETIVSSELNNPAVEGLVLNSRDVTERKHLEDRLTHLAYHDPLTNLPNRSMFFAEIDRALAQISDKRGGLALLFVDLDNFKSVNDTFGHDAGDELLRQIASRLQHAVGPDDVLGRLAGDEFTILLTNPVIPSVASEMAEHLITLLRESVAFSGNAISITPSIGISWTDDPTIDPDELLRQADAAMYAAKRNGRNRAELFEPWMADEMRKLEEQRAQEHYSSSTTGIAGTRDLPNT